MSEPKQNGSTLDRDWLPTSREGSSKDSEGLEDQMAWWVAKGTNMMDKAVKKLKELVAVETVKEEE